MGERTRWVSGTHSEQDFNGDPSPYTALGNFEGIKAAIRHRLNQSELSGISVTIQGARNVGMHLTRLLTEESARVYVSDVNEQSLNTATSLYGAIKVDPSKIHRLDVDVFAPCKMGGAINHVSIEEIRAPIIAGASNNQLASPELAEELKQRNILNAPDYVINADGIIDVYHQQAGNWDAHRVREQVVSIGTTLAQIFERADKDCLSTSVVADSTAEETFLNQKQVSNAAEAIARTGLMFINIGRHRHLMLTRGPRWSKSLLLNTATIRHSRSPWIKQNQRFQIAISSNNSIY
ncbi:MAG: leucine dehydrogenase [Candidatus Azotimanducaceae bacterium]|jgi:leucine dehydrogenase